MTMRTMIPTGVAIITAAFVVIGQSASPSLLRTKGIATSPYKYT